MTSTKVKLNKRQLRTGVKGVTGASVEVENQSTPVLEASTSKQKGSGRRSASSQVISNPVITIENETPDKSHIRGSRRIGRIERWLNRTKHFWKPELTPEEKDELEKRRYLAHIHRNMVIDMRTANKRIVNKLAALGFEYMRKNKNKYETEKIQRVHFSAWKYTEQTIYGMVDEIPYGVNEMDMVSERVLTALSASVRHPVDGKLDEDGLVYWISLAGRNDFVDEIMWRDMISKVPKTALPLTFIVGSTKNGGKEWRNLESGPHLLGAGETGGGKTNFMHGMICTFLSRNTPADVRLLMIDMKFGGISLNKYKGVPHLLAIPGAEPVTEVAIEDVTEEDTEEIKGKVKLPAVPTGIANTLPSAIAILKWAMEESNQRGAMFLSDKKHNPEKIEQWNKYHRNQHLPRIVIFIDELALVMDKSDVDSRKELMLIKLARYYIKAILRLSRSSGVHLCGFTQSLDKSVMGVAFKTNVSERMCFAVQDSPQSILAIGNGDAVNLMPVGRGIYKHGTDKFMVQTPLIMEADIAEVIRNAKAGKTTSEFKSQGITPEELIHYAVEECNYSLNRDRLYEHFKGQIGFDKLTREILPGMEKQIYELDGEQYTVIPGKGTLSRRVERLSDSAYRAVLANHPTPPLPPQAKPAFHGDCPECGANRTQTPCEFCGTEKLK
jgi:hypothetical protein